MAQKKAKKTKKISGGGRHPKVIRKGDNPQPLKHVPKKVERKKKRNKADTKTPRSLNGPVKEKVRMGKRLRTNVT